MSQRRTRGALAVIAPTIAAATLVAITASAEAAPTAVEGVVLAAGQNAIPGQYIVHLSDSAVQQSAVDSTARSLAATHGGTIRHTYQHSVRGFSVSMSEDRAKRLAADSRVVSVRQVQRVQALDTQTNPPSWGTDRVDQRDLPLDREYTYPANAGEGVTVYVVDSGIRRTHQDFGDRASFGPDFVDNDSDASDCNGHGTHVAGTAVGSSYGLAKKAKVVAVRVLNCSGSGSDDGIIKAIDWIKANAQKPAVVNYSVGCGSPCSNDVMDNAVKSLITSGVQWVQAAGNSNDDACRYSPQKLPEAITVGNTQENDARNSGSSHGRCLDIFAPGTNIISASHSSDAGSSTKTGTSMASPQVTGAAALYLGANRSATPQQVRDALVENASAKVTNPGTGSPNGLLYTGFIGEGGDDTQAPTAPANLRSTGSTSSSVSLAWDASTDNVAVDGYDVYTGSSIATKVTETNATVSGLTANTSYTFTVKAKDSSGNVSAASTPVTVKTQAEGGGGLVNGDFEAGDVTGWTTTGTASTVNSGAHGGTHAARLGAATATNGESTLSQTFTAASGSTLSLHYNMTCPDTLYYAWAKVTLKDNTTGVTTTPLAKTCTKGEGWKQVMASLVAGHSYTLTLVNRDDNHPDDAVSTVYDS
ncbi:MAG: S8 family serine peptidase, partial [Actinomycetota bacterium]|nr:S8 family serine peptidase [Actinomycetota bacterium]